MASIALAGIGADKKVILKTIDGVQKVSCSCCGCDSLPDEITIVFSGITVCDPPEGNPAYPSLLTTATLSRNSTVDPFTYDDGTNIISVDCVTAKDLADVFPDQVPAGVDPKSSTLLFSARYEGSGSGGGEDGDGRAFDSFPGVSAGISSALVIDDCPVEWGYGGTATISWVTT
jgi:hypothetical protein